MKTLEILLLSLFVVGCGRMPSYNGQALKSINDNPVSEMEPDRVFRAYDDLGGGDLVLPHWDGDHVAPYAFSQPWADNEQRAYEFKDGSASLKQEQIYDLYMALIKSRLSPLDIESTGQPYLNPSNPIVLGIRGMHPTRFVFNGDKNDNYNDTIVLLFIDKNGQKTVREFAGSTDPGTVDWPSDESSYLFVTPSVTLSSKTTPKDKFLYYYYVKGLHRNEYSAFLMNTFGYRVHEHRNGAPTYVRTGSGHNIHAARGVGTKSYLDSSVPVANTSAGCQVIYGQENYYLFVKTAYALQNEKFTHYFLMDAREIEQMIRLQAGSPGVSVPDSLAATWKKEWNDFSSLPFYAYPREEENPEDPPPSND